MLIVAENIQQLPQVAQQIVGHLQYNCIVFDAEMGAGKTTLIKEIVKQLGSDDKVSSPTFSIVNEYVTKNKQTIYHFDLYRLKNQEELLDLGFEEYFAPNSIQLIEWPQIAYNFLPKHYHTITIKPTKNTRQICLNTN